MRDERSTVVVGNAPPLQDIVSGAYTEKPFDLESFTAFARKNLFVENLDFLRKVDELRREPDPRTYKTLLVHIMAEHIGDSAPSEVNLSDESRRKMEERVMIVNDALDKDPYNEPPDRGCLDGAYEDILSMVRADQFARYKEFIVVQRQLRVARLDALWWKQDGLTLKTFFSFPSPVNSAESRLHACLVTFLVPAASALAVHDVPWLWVFITYGYLARVTCGPRMDPNALFVLFALRPLVVDKLGLMKNEFSPGSPKRFAQLVGLVFAVSCAVLAFWEQYLPMVIVAACLFAASFLAGYFDLCLACIVFMAGVRANLLPRSVCEDCSIRYIKGGEQETTPTYRKRAPNDKITRKDEEVGGGGSVGGSDVVIGNGNGTDDKSKQACSMEGGHQATGGRNMGTWGGSVANGGPTLGTPSTVSVHQEGDTPTTL